MSVGYVLLSSIFDTLIYVFSDKSPRQYIADTNGLASPLAAASKNFDLAAVSFMLMLLYRAFNVGLLTTYASTVR